MTRGRTWTGEELAVLRDVYPTQGVPGLRSLLPGRSAQAIHVKANKLGLVCTMVPEAPKPRLAGDDLAEAVRLREEEGWSFARIAGKFGISESGANNAIMIVLCARRGFTPAQRDEQGRLTPEGRERIRYALKKGLKGVDIQLRLGVSAGCVSEQRRRYNRELRERGKAPLPRPGAGTAYSGAKLTRAQRVEVETLFLAGLGTMKIAERTGISKTSCGRIRKRLVRRLRRQGECLPGCDSRGVRHVQAESARFVPQECRAALEAMLLDRVPVARAARILAIGGCSAYRIRDELAASLAARGETLPEPENWRGWRRPADSYWPPAGAKEIYDFRALLQEMPFDQAKAEWRRRKAEALRAERDRPKSFEEQLQLVAAGKVGLTAAIPRRHLEPAHDEQRRSA